MHAGIRRLLVTTTPRCTCPPAVSSCSRNHDFCIIIFFIITQKYGNLFFLLQPEANYLAQLTRIVSLAEIDGERVFLFDIYQLILVQHVDMSINVKLYSRWTRTKFKANINSALLSFLFMSKATNLERLSFNKIGRLHVLSMTSLDTRCYVA